MTNLRFFTILLGLMIIYSPMYSQVTVGDNKTPETFSLLELVSGNNKGLRLPQISTTAQRDLIFTNVASFTSNPLALGLQIFNLQTRCVEVWNGTNWKCTEPLVYSAASPITLNTATQTFGLIPGNDAGQILKWNGSAWQLVTETTGLMAEVDGVVGNEVLDATPNGGLVRTGAGTAASPFTLGIVTTGANAGYVIKWDGTKWAPAADANTTYTATAPVNISGTNVVSITGGTNGQVLTTNSSGTPVWQTPVDNNTTYTANAPITLTGTAFGITTGTTGQVLTSNASGAPTWQTLNINDADPIVGNEVTNSTDLTLVRSGSGTAAAPYTLARAAITGDAVINAGSNASVVTALQGRALPATATQPTNGQILKYNGTAWTYAADDNTTYTGSTSVVLNSTSFERAALTGDVTAAQNNNAVTVVGLQGRPIVTTAPLNEQALVWNGTAWKPQTAWLVGGNNFINSGEQTLGSITKNDLRFIIRNTTAGMVKDMDNGGSVAFGQMAAQQSIMNNNVCNTVIGFNALRFNTTGSSNTVVGDNSMQSIKTGSFNTALGTFAGLGFEYQIPNNCNTLIGYNAGGGILGGSCNLIVTAGPASDQADPPLDIGTANYNIVIGARSLPDIYPNNLLNIGNCIYGIDLTYANKYSTVASTLSKIGINTQEPTATLDINGTARVRNLPIGARTDQMVTADADGNLRQMAIPTTNTYTGTAPVNVSSSNVISVTPGFVGQVLTSTASAVNWQYPALQMIMCDVGAGVGLGTNVNWPTAAGGNQMINKQTGSSITLPPGKWMVYVQMLMPIQNFPPAGDFLWLRTSFSNAANSYAISPDIDNTIGTQFISGSYYGMSKNGALPISYTMMQGFVIINNTTAASKKYFYFVHSCDTNNGYPVSGTSPIVVGFGGTGATGNQWGEDVMYAIPILQ